ncbi:hypothetical protein QR680_018048 [Steinernema hermaphroditum]|uniref:SXP/RAL-2 family protein Ani s 5-like cation-binding domain-containing protein n=1 Tax=Steinernema hermaphroditum TaxID=289476 RepID=A0AA39LPS1_9BILA|nr:hypothetical protein QR680_018048 [Steinernema hermaphroditum]
MIWRILVVGAATIGSALSLGNDSFEPAGNGSISSPYNLTRSYNIGEAANQSHSSPGNMTWEDYESRFFQIEKEYLFEDDNVTAVTPYYDGQSKLDQWRDKIRGFGSKLKGWWHIAKDKMKEKFSNFKGQFSEAAHNVKDYFHNVTEPFRDSWRDFQADMQQKSAQHEKEFEALKQTFLAQATASTAKTNVN